MDTRGVPENQMHFCGEPTSDFDQAGMYLRTWYEANCPELILGGPGKRIWRRVRRALFGYVDYDIDRDRHNLMLGLINEVKRIETERYRQVFPALGASGVEASGSKPGSAGSNPDEGTNTQEAGMSGGG